jgi:tetratricopeptide (TPR) repeat protein
VHAHPHPHPSGTRPAWGEPRPGPIRRLVRALRERLGPTTTAPVAGLPELPLALRRTDIAVPYLAAEEAGDHPTAAAAAADAAEQSIAAEDWWPADAWAHRALWHYERAEMALEATRQARRIGDLRTAAGDPDSARRYYAEAIDEARDIGAEHEQGLAALGLGRALLEMGEVTQARRLASASVTLLERSSAPAGELTAARELLGTEVSVGEAAEEGD